MHRHIWNNYSWLFFSFSWIKQQSLYSETEISIGNKCRISCLPVESPVWKNWNVYISVVWSECSGRVLGYSNLKSWNNSRVNRVTNRTNEENFECWSEIGPNVSPDLNINIKSVDICSYINSVYFWNDSAVRKSLSLKLETKPYLNCFDDNITVALCSEWPTLISEFVVVENTR